MLNQGLSVSENAHHGGTGKPEVSRQMLFPTDMIMPHIAPTGARLVARHVYNRDDDHRLNAHHDHADGTVTLIVVLPMMGYADIC